MKTTVLVSLALVAASVAQAQMYRPDTRRGSHTESRRHEDRRDHHRTSVHVGVGHYGHHGHHGGHHTGYRIGYSRPWFAGSGWYSPIGYYSPYRYVPAYGYYDGYGYGYPYYGNSVGYYGSGSAATNGLVLGALAGGIIGHNSGEFRHNGWRGAAWGAGLGWLLGAVADSNRRAVVSQAPSVVAQPPPVYSHPQSAPAAQPAQPVTIINNYYNSSTPMSGANGLFGR